MATHLSPSAGDGMSEPLPRPPARFPQPPGADRRGQPRHGRAGMHAYLIRDAEATPGLVTVSNLSARGIGVISPGRFEKGAELELLLENPASGFRCFVAAQVAYVVQHPAGHCILGCCFTRALTDDELRGLL